MCMNSTRPGCGGLVGRGFCILGRYRVKDNVELRGDIGVLAGVVMLEGGGSLVFGRKAVRSTLSFLR